MLWRVIGDSWIVTCKDCTGIVTFLYGFEHDNFTSLYMTLHDYTTCYLINYLINFYFILTWMTWCCRYEPFDFHHECRKMRYDRLQILLDRINPEQEEYGYFLLMKDGSVVQQQDGVFRTNCIDCLDRTNVVQSLLARRNLLQVFQVHTLILF